MSGFTRRLQAEAAQPFGSYKPTSANTGIPSGTILTPITQDYTITTAGTVLENLDITGWVVVKAANVVIRKCRIRGGAAKTFNTGLIDCNDASVLNLVVQDCLLVPDNPSLWYDGIIGHDYTIERCEIYNTVDGCGAYNSNATGPINVRIYGNYIHDLSWYAVDPNHSNGPTHNDCIQVQGGDDWEIIGNNLQGFVSSTAGDGSTMLATTGYSDYYANSAIQTNLNTSPTITGVRINNNWADGGGETFNLACNGTYTATTMHFDRINYNRFGRNSRLQGSGGDTTYTIDMPSTTTWDSIAGNVYDDNDDPVDVRHNG